MSFAHGKTAKLYCNGWDISPFLTKVSVSAKADTAETSTLGTTDKQYLNGMMDSSISGDGFYSDNPGHVASIMGSAFGGTANPLPNILFTHLPQGDSLGKKAFGMVSVLTDWNIDTDTGGPGAVTVTGSNNTGLDQGYSIHPLAQESGPGSSLMVDCGAIPGPTVKGADSYLHVTQSSGGALVVKTQHSSDNITYVDLCVHTAVTVSHKAEKISSLVAVPTGNVFRYLKATWTLASGTATFSLVLTRLAQSH